MTLHDSQSASDAAAAADDLAVERLWPTVYSDLRRIAYQKLAQEQPGQTLQPTALVHEAFVRLVDPQRPQQWTNRAHFFAAAAEAMRRILIENARRKQRLCHGGELNRMPFDDVELPVEGPHEDILALDEVLQKFAEEEPQKARLVKLRYFAGLDEQEAAESLGISRATAARWWAYARAWLFQRLADSDESNH
jgi:RNA polymerase sigma factor (TIGR02999 family)